MTRDDIIRMAKEARLPYEYDTGRIMHLKEIEQFAILIAAAERKKIVQMFATYKIPEAVSAAGKTARLWTQTALEKIAQKLREKNSG